MRRWKSNILLILIYSIPFLASAQNRWMRSYHDELNTPMLFISNSYDHGCLISGRSKPNYPKYNWLIKIDINGEILWEKTIGNGIHTIVLNELYQNDSGFIYLCGGLWNEDPYGDPFILKLNPCGNIEWCQIFNTPNNPDFADCFCLTKDGGCAVTLVMTGITPWIDRICLAKFSSAGELEWKQCYNSQDSMLGNEDSENLILTPDNGYLITGWCYYADPTGTFNMIHPYYIKCDSLGNFQWETIAEKETGFTGGEGWQTVTDPNNTFFYSSISRYHIDSLNSGDSPALLKMNMQGEIINIYELAEPGEVGKLWDARFLNDSLLAASASWGDPDYNSPMAVIIDTLGNIKKQSFLLDNRYMSYVRPTYDRKIFFYTEDFNPQTEDFSVYLFKLNENLEDDTIYTRPFTYDSLCPYQIVSDTIVPDDCGLIVGIEEQGGGEAGKPGGREAGKRGGLEVWPNPAKEVLSVKVLGLSSGIDYELVIYDIFGRLILSSTPIIPPFGGTEGGLQINVESFPPGVYIAILKKGIDLVDSSKFVIAR
jgi:hypothetical protein